jgi:phosphoribosylanthranilate isomerase
MTRVKICGLTRADDVRLAAELGAWACGFVLTESPRRISPAAAAQLTKLSGDALTVGVFATETADEIAAALAVAAVAAVQLSAGAHGPSVAAVSAAALRLGLRPRFIAPADTTGAEEADYLLLDGRAPGRYGGTGRAADLDAAADLAAGRRLVLAGGLRPDNVQAAIKRARPFAVDVAGGVERAPGVKDQALLSAFFHAVDHVDHTGGTSS